MEENPPTVPLIEQNSSLTIQRKSHLKLLVSLLVLTIVAGIASLTYLNTQFSKQAATSEILVPPVAQTPTETGEWKTYNNEAKTFEIKYPSFLILTFLSELSEGAKGIKLSSHKPDAVLGNTTRTYDIFIDEKSIEENISFSDWIKKHEKIEQNDGNIISTIYGSINPYTALEDVEEAVVFEGGYELVGKHVYIRNKNEAIQFSLYSGPDTGSSYKDNPDGELVFDQILSTFRFLE